MKRLIGLFLGALVCAWVSHVSVAGASTETVRHVFGSGNDGNSPGSNLIEVDGMLYGTTVEGGSGSGGCGTVFSFDPKTDAETVLYAFKCGTGGDGNKDGGEPNALINVNGTLYGTTQFGGDFTRSQYGCGTVFSITTSGTFKHLYSFKYATGNYDGCDPTAAMLNVNGMLYGTTYTGGQYDNGDGTVFTITLSGKENVLHSLDANVDGNYPYAGLINVSGTLYGAVEDNNQTGYGDVFSLDPKKGTTNVLYDFQCAGDGGVPDGNLLNVSGKLYGTTVGGGEFCANDGTLFSLTPGGKFKTLYAFQKSGNDGANPEAGVIKVNGVLYGTTPNGGGTTTCGSNECGTIYSYDLATGKFNTVYTFQGGTDGGRSFASLLNVKGVLYGTTTTGGGSGSGHCFFNYGCGTIFSFKP